MAGVGQAAHRDSQESVTSLFLPTSRTFIPETASYHTPGAPPQPDICICVQEHLEAAQHVLSVAALEAVGRTVLPMEFASEAPGITLGFSTASHQSHL